MDKEEVISRIIKKKEFSQLPKKDVEKVLEKFERREIDDEDKVKLSRALLKKIFTSFMGRKIMNPKSKDARWFLLRHVSTKERFDYYSELYERLLEDFKEKEISILDLGSGINGVSYCFFPKNKKINYVGVEAVGQLVNVMNFYFKENKINGIAISKSLFELEEIKKIIKKLKKTRIVFLFKVLDSLEMLKGDYSKEFLKEIVPLADKVVVSFATKSFFKREKFKVNRKWFFDFCRENFHILDNFEFPGENYLVLKKRES